MNEQYACLNSDWLLRGWSDAPYVLVNRESGAYIILNGEAEYVAKSCDGFCNFASPAYLPKHRAVLKMFCDAGISRFCERGCTLEALQEYRYADNPMLLEIHWAVTGFCNMNCGHCFMQSPSGKYKECSRDEMEMLMEQFRKANVVNISLTGGEPLMREDFPWLIKRLTEQGFFINEIVTNGLLIDEWVFHLLESCGQHPRFQISFDGVGMHDRMRGTDGCEGKTLQAIKHTVTAGYFTAVSTIFSRANIGTIENTYKALKELGVPLWLLGRAQTTGNWKGGKDALTIEELAQACMGIQKCWLADGRPMRIAMEQFYAAQPLGYRSHQMPEYVPDSLECPETSRRMFLLPDGRLLPCTGFTGTPLEKDMPNLKEQELSEVLKSSALQRFVHDTKRIRWEELEECRNCIHYAKCGSGCRAFAMSEAGDIRKADPVTCETYRGGWKEKFMLAEEAYMQREKNGIKENR